jgi:hypothetical protein
MRAVKNPEIGHKVGRITLLEITSTWAANYRFKKTANCICECGEAISMPLHEFGNKRSCGCLIKDKSHGKSHSKIWRAWQGMKRRCLCKTNKKYNLWGGRGIKICGYLMEFKNFQKLMGEPISKSHSLDREDNNGNYSCGNCPECLKNNWKINVRWATNLQQSQNLRSNHKIIHKGESLCLSEVARKIGLPYKTLYSRIRVHNWDVETAINTPLSKPHILKRLKNDKTNREVSSSI